MLVGYGRVGSTIGRALARVGIPYVVVERDRVLVESIRREGVMAEFGDAARPGVLAPACPERARLLVTTVPDAYHAARIIELARQANPDIDTAARIHTEGARVLMQRLGVGRTVMGELELALGLAHFAPRRMAVPTTTPTPRSRSCDSPHAGDRTSHAWSRRADAAPRHFTAPTPPPRHFAVPTPRVSSPLPPPPP